MSEPQTIRYVVLTFISSLGYRVGEDGSIWSCLQRVGRDYITTNTWVKMKLYKNHWGYETITIWDKGKQIVANVHRLVLEAFVGPKSIGMQCRHLDGNKTNNHLSNLKWGTPKEDADDKRRHGTQLRGELIPTSKLKRVQVDEMRRLYATGEHYHKDLAVKYEINATTVGEIVRNEIWFDPEYKPVKFWRCGKTRKRMN